jgi:hypothetical protein
MALYKSRTRKKSAKQKQSLQEKADGNQLGMPWGIYPLLVLQISAHTAAHRM